MNDLHSENINDEILLSTKDAQEKHVFANSKICTMLILHMQWTLQPIAITAKGLIFHFLKASPNIFL